MQAQQVSLTKIQTKTFKFVKNYIKNKGEGPTFAQISEHLGGNNDTVGHGHMKALQKKGVVTWEPRKANSIRILRDIYAETKVLELKPLAKTNGQTNGHSNGMNGHGHHTNGVTVKTDEKNVVPEPETVEQIMSSGGGSRSKDDILSALSKREAFYQEQLAEIQIARKVVNGLAILTKAAEVTPN